ncbi:hypothetical protein RDABS01_007319 [Bienertia sinuspersici]
MELRGCLPDVVSYSIIINGYCQLGELERVLKLVNEMRMKGLKPMLLTFNSIILLMCKSGKVADAERVLREMIDGYCKTGKLREAFFWHNEMVEKGMSPNVVTYAASLMAFDMEVTGFHPDAITYTTLMDAYCMMEDGERLLKWMLEKGIMPNATTYNSLMKHYCIRSNIRASTEIYREMCAQNVIPDSNTCNILIKGHSKARNLKEAWYLHKEMVAKGFGLTGSSYNALIKGFMKKKKYGEAKELFDEMRSKGFIADQELLSFFLDKNYDAGNVGTALELCDEVVERFLDELHSRAAKVEYETMTMKQRGLPGKFRKKRTSRDAVIL